MKRLFVGGYAHGTVRDVPEDHDTWNVPVPAPVLRFVEATDAIPESDMRIDSYELLPVYVNELLLSVFVLPGHRSWLPHALVKAAGLIE